MTVMGQALRRGKRGLGPADAPKEQNVEGRSRSESPAQLTLPMVTRSSAKPDR
jgi:hypothetical protein